MNSYHLSQFVLFLFLENILGFAFSGKENKGLGVVSQVFICRDLSVQTRYPRQDTP